MSLTARLVALLVLVAALGAGWWRLTAYYDGRGYRRAQAEARDLADAQERRNRELQRAAELRYTVQAGVRDRFIVQTIREVRHATANLAGCVLSPDARRLLNDAAACAGSDRPASCGPGDAVPAP